MSNSELLTFISALAKKPPGSELVESLMKRQRRVMNSRCRPPSRSCRSMRARSQACGHCMVQQYHFPPEGKAHRPPPPGMILAGSIASLWTIRRWAACRCSTCNDCQVEIANVHARRGKENLLVSCRSGCYEGPPEVQQPRENESVSDRRSLEVGRDDICGGDGR